MASFNQIVGPRSGPARERGHPEHYVLGPSHWLRRSWEIAAESGLPATQLHSIRHRIAVAGDGISARPFAVPASVATGAYPESGAIGEWRGRRA
jgi:hypothetical protein